MDYYPLASCMGVRQGENVSPLLVLLFLNTVVVAMGFYEKTYYVHIAMWA